MSQDQSKEPVLPTTNESSPAVEHVKVLLKRMAKTRADSLPRNGRKRKRTDFGCRRKKSNPALVLPARLRTYPAGIKGPRLPGALVQYGGTLRRVRQVRQAPL